MIRIILSVLLLVGSAPLVLANPEHETAATAQEMIERLKRNGWQEAAQQCTGQYCCCNAGRRGIVCVTRTKCESTGGRCTARTSCPR